MVKGYMSAKQKATNGLKLLLRDVEPFGQVQASWRFLNNENVKVDELCKPIEESLEEGIKKHCNEYVLAMSDWSHLDYRRHKSKKELISKNKKDTCKQIGYDLQTTLAVSDKTGEPIAPIVHNLKTNEKVYSNYDNNISLSSSHLEELASRAKWIEKSLKTDKKIVHIVDRESDSVAFMRDLVSNDNVFLLRVKSSNKLYFPKEDITIKQGELADKLDLGKKVKSIKYQNKKVTIYVNECEVEVRRDASRYIFNEEGKKQLQTTKGEAIKARFVVERLVDEENNIVAQWLLISNILDKKISSQTLATWYYYRWKIESYFKLLKSSGFNLEAWQQEKPIALFRRLLIVSFSCVLVWKIANDSSQNAKQIREFLILLSGRQIERGKEFTHPSLLAGLESFLQIMDVMLLFSHKELLDMKKKIIEIMGMDV
jgi:hypothetical protein